MSRVKGKFGDLAARAASGVAMAGAGLVLAWAGGWWFLALACAVVGGMVWELVRLLNPGAAQRRALGLGGLAAGVTLAGGLLPPGFALPLLFAPALAGISVLSSNRTLYIMFSLLIVIAGFGLLFQREEFGFVWLAWLLLVVVATDVLGYFAGRILGGPKFWPRVSPKKTWSGTVAGWVASAAVGAGFMVATGAGAEILGISVALSMAAQVGDIAESAVKRKMGAKDSSHLIPGHGGLLDRFDGLLGASIFLLFVEQIVDFPPGLASGAM